MSSRGIRCDNETHNILIVQKQITGKSIPQLLRIAVVNMPFIPPQNIIRKKK